jgi:diguanylate cyclase (GGDEF)-like protein
MARVLGGETSANARALACVWAFGAACLTATLILPHPAAANDVGLAVIAAVAFPVAAFMFLRAADIPRGALEAFTYLGQGLITGLTIFWSAPEPPYLWFHVWLVVHSFHYLPRSRAMMQVVGAAVLFTVGTVVAGSPFPAATSVVGVGSIVTIGILVGAFRARVDELLRALERSASSDPLTGLANRRAFAEAYARDRAIRARSGRGGALLVLDCDGLKELNDRGGHAAGDRALCRVAAAMSASLREVDTAARLGGDEFAVLLGAAEAGTAPAIGERIRHAVAAGHPSDGLTLSIGVVELPADAPADLNAALAAADRAMYRSKSTGGDRVSVGGLGEPLAQPAPATTPRPAGRTLRAGGAAIRP